MDLTTMANALCFQLVFAIATQTVPKQRLGGKKMASGGGPTETHISKHGLKTLANTLCVQLVSVIATQTPPKQRLGEKMMGLGRGQARTNIKIKHGLGQRSNSRMVSTRSCASDRDRPKATSW